MTGPERTLQFSEFIIKGFAYPLKSAMRKPATRSLGNWLAFYDACDLANDVRHGRASVEITEATHGR